MLRIAEYNKVTGKKIELKELEKFGFDLKMNTEDNYDQLYCFDSNLMFDKIDKNIIIPIFNEEKALDTLYDLITNGYVEKDDNNEM